MLDACEVLAANVSKLVLCENITKTDKAFHELLMYKMTIKFNVFCALMED